MLPVMAASKVKSWYNKFHSIATACFDTACFLGAEEEILFLQDPLVGCCKHPPCLPEKLSQQGFKGFKSEDFVVVELPADRDCQVEAPPPPPQPKRRRDRGEWAQYSPEDDDYDMTAATRPPQSGEEHVADLQVGRTAFVVRLCLCVYTHGSLFVAMFRRGERKQNRHLPTHQHQTQSGKLQNHKSRLLHLFLQAVNLKQILHLAGRVTAGGEIHVIQHYAICVVLDNMDLHPR